MSEVCATSAGICSKSFNFKIGGNRVKLLRGTKPEINGEGMGNSLDYETTDSSIRISVIQDFSVFMQLRDVATGFELRFQWNGGTIGYLTIPRRFMDVNETDSFTFVGLCGSFNDNPEDDFLTQNNLVIEDADDFGHSWVDGSCPTPPTTDEDEEECQACIHWNKKKKKNIF